MRAKAKSSSTPYPIWVEGEYITEPPIRPSDGAIRPAGHYIDKGGYPGANVYTIKGPTVEIPLSEYMSLREEVGNLRITVERLDRENMEMRSKERVNREVTNIVENAEKRILEEIKKVTESDTLRRTEV